MPCVPLFQASAHPRTPRFNPANTYAPSGPASTGTPHSQVPAIHPTDALNSIPPVTSIATAQGGSHHGSDA